MRLLFLLALLMYPSPVAPGPRLIVMGDSIALGVGASTPDRSWAALTAVALRRDVINVAISGSKVAQQPIPTVHAGDLVVWLVGYNDMRAATPIAHFQATIASGVAQLRQQGAIVVLASGLRMSSAGYAAYGPTWNHGSDSSAAAYADSVRSMTEFIDLTSIDPTPVADLVHPNDAQYATIAQAIIGRRVVRLPVIDCQAIKTAP